LRFLRSSSCAFRRNRYLNANHVPTRNRVSKQSLGAGTCQSLGSLLSPTNVPAATIAKPIQRPYTTPHSSAMISWPKSGGNEMTKRIAMGMSQPAGRSRTFSENGRSACAWLLVIPNHMMIAIQSYCDNFVVFYCYHNCCYQNEDTEYVPGCKPRQHMHIKRIGHATYVCILVIT
jgi:hypothetical protein